MAEYIEREALLDRLKTHIKRITPIEESRDMFYHDSGVNGAVTGAVLEVEKASAADVEPEVHGRWVSKDSRNPFSWRYCSECGHTVTASMARSYKGCPVCLARMDGDGNG